MTPVCKVLLVVDFDPKEASEMLLLPHGLRFNFVAISWVINDLWAPSSKMMFPSIITSGELNMAIAVFSRQELVCIWGELESEIAGVNSSVVFTGCPVPLVSLVLV